MRVGTKRQQRKALPAPGHWSRDCLAGGLVGAIGLLRLVALASLLYSGRLAGYLPAGLTLLLLGAVPMLVIGAWRSSHPGTVVAPQDVPCVVLAAIAGGLCAGLPRGTGFATVVTALVLSGMASGLALWLLGRLRGGVLIGWIPLPAVLGLLVGVGSLMLLGGLNLAAGTGAGWRDLRPLASTSAVLRWLPALLLAILFLTLSRRWQRWWVLPCSLAGAIALFYAGLGASGENLANARAGGWLLGPFDVLDARLPLPWDILAGADWPALGRQAWTLLLVPVATIAAMLVNTSALERVADGTAIDRDRELRATGLANLLAAPVAPAPGFVSLALTRLGQRLGGRGRMVGIAAALVTTSALVLGPGWLVWLPRPVVAGLLLMIALDLLVTQLWDRRGDWLRWRYAVAVLIAAALTTAAVLLGIMG